MGDQIAIAFLFLAVAIAFSGCAYMLGWCKGFKDGAALPCNCDDAGEE